MCCTECLAKSGVGGMHSAHAEGQLPAIVAGATACMRPMEEGCICHRWVGGPGLQRDVGEDLTHSSKAIKSSWQEADRLQSILLMLTARLIPKPSAEYAVFA